MDFKRPLTETGKLERKGPAVLAAGVFNIYIYIYIYMSICAEIKRKHISTIVPQGA